MIPQDALKTLASDRHVSDTEFAVLSLAIAGKSMVEIAAELDIDSAAVRKRLGEVYRKFHIAGKGPGKLAKLQQLLLSTYREQQDAGDRVAGSDSLSGDLEMPEFLSQQVTTQMQPAPDHLELSSWSPANSSSDIDSFYGREAELNMLEEWIVIERCRLVELLGSGGIGKTSLCQALVKRIKLRFERVAWVALDQAPPLKQTLATLLYSLSQGQETELPENLQNRISRLLSYMQRYRCLLILDGAEAILRSDALAGIYQEEFQDYEMLLRWVAKTEHQSCLLITSSEKTQEFTELEGKKVRAYPLPGLDVEEGRSLFKEKGIFANAEADWQTVVERYGGNPLALKIASVTIQEVFGGNLSEFLQQGTTVFGDIRKLLEQQFNRLLNVENYIIYWLAVSAEPIALTELREDMVPPVSQPRLLEALESLGRRSLVERDQALFSLQPVVMEYGVNRLIEQICEEISSGKIKLFNSHALIKATAKDYVRERQIRGILQPLTEKLMAQFENEAAIKQRLLQIVAAQQQSAPKPGYLAGNILNLFWYMKIDISDSDFSRLTVRQAYLKEMPLHGVNFMASDLSGTVFAEKLGSILTVAFSPDGTLLATGDTDSNIRLWNVATAELFSTWQGHEDWVRTLVFSPDGQKLASGSEDKTVRLWQVSTGQCLTTLEGHRSWIRSIDFSPDGQILASGGDDSEIRLWNVATGVCLNQLTEHTNVVRSVAFSPDGQFLASGSRDCTIRLWDVATGTCLRVLHQHKRGVRSVTFSPDGRFLASGSSDHLIGLWEVATGTYLQSFTGHRGWIWSVTFSPDGEMLASGSEDQTVRIWQRRTGKCLKVLSGHMSWVRSVKFSPDGQLLASGSDDQTVRLWDISSGQRIKTLQGYARGIRSVAFNPNGQLLASGSEDRTVRIWDLKTEQCLITLPGHTGRVWSVAFSADGQMLASGSEDHTIRLWHMGTGECFKILSGYGDGIHSSGHRDGVHSVAFSPDGQLLASGSCDNTVKLWNVSTGECLETLQGHADWVWSVAFSPDGQLLASGSSDFTVRLWNLNTRQCLKILKGHNHWIRSIAFSPDGKTLASSSVGRTVRLWDVQSGKESSTLDGFRNGIRSVAFSPDNRFLASGSNDRVVRVWDVQSGECLHSFRGHTDRVQSVAFSLDGKLLVSGSNDETMKIWDIETGKELKTLRFPRLYEEMNITGSSLLPAKKTTLIGLGAIDQHVSY